MDGVDDGARDERMSGEHLILIGPGRVRAPPPPCSAYTVRGGENGVWSV